MSVPQIRSEPRSRAALALMLIAPAPTVGVLMAMSQGSVGTAIWMFAKIWLLLLPVAWHVLVDRRPITWSPPHRGGFFTATLLGLAISAVIVAAYFVIGRTLLVPAEIRAALKPPELMQPAYFIGAAIYWITINSALEEYVYRWFIFRKAEVLSGSGVAAVLISAAIFVVHHAVALAHYTEPLVAGLASAGVFIGGAVWSWLYLRYRSVWVPWVSHAIVDIAVFGVAGWIIFKG
jgi:membrane protease YdiL (CAAX protease family)